MPTLVINETGANGSAHDYADVATIATQLKTWANTTKLDYDNIQSNGIRTDNVRAHAGANVGQIKVRNDSGSTITTGKLVYFSGTYSDGTDNYPTIALADASSGTPFRAQAVVEASIANDADGTVLLFFELSGEDTSSGSVGDPVYLSTTAGDYTLTEPTGSDLIQVVGVISVDNASTGRIIFSINPGTAVDKTIGSPLVVGTLTLASGSITDSSGAISFGNETLTTTGVITGLTVEATGDTAAGDNAAMGYTATEGLILTGQGSTNDVTIKNDADATVMSIATGTTATTFAGTVTTGGNILSDTDSTDDLGTTGVRWANLFVDDITLTTSLTAGGAISGGAGTLTSLSVSDGNITNVGDIALDSLSSDAGAAITITPTTDTHFSNGTGVVIGHTAQVSTGDAGTAELQVLGTAAADASQVWGRWSANTLSPILAMMKSRNAAIGSNTIVQDGDNLGLLQWNADDGTDYVSTAAQIAGQIDGTPGANDTPGRLVFSTTADGASTVTERMRIDAAGNVILSAGSGGILDLGTTGFRIDLDTDNDTSIRASADDTIDFEVGGVDALQLANSGGDQIFKLEAVATTTNAQFVMKVPASSTSGDPRLTWRQGAGDGTANNMQYDIKYEGDNAYLSLTSADTDGAAASADIWRILDGQTTIDANTTWDNNVFDYVCNTCGWHNLHRPAKDECPECGGHVEWHDDNALIYDLVSTDDRREVAFKQFEKMGVMYRDGKDTFMPLQTAQKFSFSAMSQLYQVVKLQQEEIEELKRKVA